MPKVSILLSGDSYVQESRGTMRSKKAFSHNGWMLFNKAPV